MQQPQPPELRVHPNTEVGGCESLLHLGHCIKVSRGSAQGCDSHWLGDLTRSQSLSGHRVPFICGTEAQGVSRVNSHLTVPSASIEDANFALVISHCFDNSHPSGCEVARHCGFHLYFPSDYDVEHLFMCLLVPCTFPWRNVYSNLCIVEVSCLVFFVVELLEVSIYSGMLIPW